MSKNFVDNQNNEVIARAIGMSVNNYIRRFRQEIGLSPQRYCMNRRLDKARNLLLNTESSIDEIAAKTAFANRYHFSKAFKNFFKISPSAFRKEHLLNYPPDAPSCRWPASCVMDNIFRRCHQLACTANQVHRLSGQRIGNIYPLTGSRRKNQFQPWRFRCEQHRAASRRNWHGILRDSS
jgi:AraC-like DNA-binding protein